MAPGDIHRNAPQTDHLIVHDDGKLITLILPNADVAAMSLHLVEVARRQPHEHVLMFLNRAGTTGPAAGRGATATLVGVKPPAQQLQVKSDRSGGVTGSEGFHE